MEFIWMHQIASVWKLFMEANILQHEAVFTKSYHLKSQDEMRLAC